MKVIGLDVGDVAGICVIEFDFYSSVIRHVEVREITPQELDEKFVYRLAAEIESVILAESPQLVVIEGYAFGGSGFFKVSQAEITGQIKRFMVDRGIVFYEAHISHMRKVVTGNGRIKKPANRNFVREWFAERDVSLVKSKKFHVYDACTPAIMGFLYLNRELEEEEIRNIDESIIGGRV